jgi:rSAM/selenodomain-associated transferase 2
LPATLAALHTAPAAEIVLADGGSTDDTISVARSAGARVVLVPLGRGIQLAAGANAANAKWLLFLHADCVPEPGWSDAVNAFIARPDAESRAGYFDFSLDDSHPAARRLERIVAWRCRILGLPYGDQGLLLSRKLYNAAGGFAPLPLMEDVDLVRRLGRQRLTRIGMRCVASARRYRRDGYWRRPLRNLFCLSLYFVGVAPKRIARIYG